MGCGASRVSWHPGDTDAIREPIGPVASTPDKHAMSHEGPARSQLMATELQSSSGMPQQQVSLQRGSSRFAFRDRVAAAGDGGSTSKEGGAKVVESAVKSAMSATRRGAFSRRRSSSSMTEQQIFVIRLQAHIRARQARQQLQRRVQHTPNVKIQRDRDSVCRTLTFVCIIIWQDPSLRRTSRAPTHDLAIRSPQIGLRRVNGYKVREVLGSGAYGQVFRATKHFDVYAIKARGAKYFMCFGVSERGADEVACAASL